MSTIDEINEKIRHLKEKIKEYWDKISELEEAYDYISERKTGIENDYYYPANSFDMTWSGEWQGKCESDADKLRAEMIHQAGVGLSDTAKLLEDILAAIENIKELIKECEAKIESLRAERDAMMSPQEG
ncbi:hypothetical protein [Butyrivibrio sp. INlla21]|uniref:hypothetical protein n=1 Tax=Butyrivibrio sp. INlla21 TaxID=1520811 RepID=UPI0008E485C9|nr:hypothetical protein [Butyrivibrio sp. INlla21]SFU67428.1 hypothetical protein SAMN02910342_01334 [Butyrivibrio sp. INlla21]